MRVRKEDEEWQMKKPCIRKGLQSSGRWSMEENQIYLQFLKDNTLLFEGEFIRRSKRIFSRLAKLIPTRTP